MKLEENIKCAYESGPPYEGHESACQLSFQAFRYTRIPAGELSRLGESAAVAAL